GMTDPERRFRQLPGEMMVAALPEASADDARMKKIFMNNCTGCHWTSYALQFRFDEAGWSKIIDLMKMVPVTGVYPGPNAKSNQIIERHQKQLSAYLARARGPGDSSMKVAPRARPTGEAARAVWTLYDLPLNPDAGIGTRYNANDGTDWSLGTTSKMGQLPHDGALGLDGTIYFTCNNPNRGVTIGKVDPVTGAVKYLKADGAKGLAATTHGLARDRAGNLWFDINPGRRALGRLDTATEKITIYQTPESMAPVGGAVTIDVDGKGTDKNADLLWVGNSYGSSWAKINTRTLETTIVPLPDPAMQAYHIAVDSKHNAWGNLWTADRIVKLDPGTNTWTIFDLPVRGTEIRHIALSERGDKVSVVVPVYRTSQMGVMTVRSEAELAMARAP